MPVYNDALGVIEMGVEVDVIFDLTEIPEVRQSLGDDLRAAGFGFDFQYFGIAVSAAVVLAAAVFLPRGRAVPTAAQVQSAE